MRLLQVCNVGSRLGGTGACVASVVAALPDWTHEVLVRGRLEADFSQALPAAEVRRVDGVSASDSRAADVVLLHNTPPGAVRDRLPSPTIQYVHSDGPRAAAEKVVCCSRHLSALRGQREEVLWQGVPRTVADGPDVRPLRERLLVGRLCTPTAAKWPCGTADFYASLAGSCPFADFEFVGCPDRLTDRLRDACGGRAAFVPAGPDARRRLTDWDILLYANRRVTETFGRTVAEAMRAGCIPVVDDLGGFREQLDAGGGVLCRTVNDFRSALSHVHAAGRRRAMSRHAVSVADDRFSIAAFRRRLLAAFEAL